MEHLKHNLKGVNDMNRTTLDFILETQEELHFPDGYAMTDWSGHKYCLYQPNQEFGQGKVLWLGRGCGLLPGACLPHPCL